MKFIIPIQNLIIENIYILDEIILIPHKFFDELEDYLNNCSLDKGCLDKIIEVLEICKYEYIKNYSNYVVALLNYPFSNKQFESNIPTEEFIFLEELCYKVDRALDYFRLSYCHFNKLELLPGIPGIVENFRKGVVVDVENNRCRELLGNVYNIYVNPGIGLYVDSMDGLTQSIDYKLLFCGRTDEVYNRCRMAISRVNQALYFNNVNASFVYLMSTLDMLASENYLGFQKVKTCIISFVATNKKDYYEKCEELKKISKDIRTEIVHNGKSLYDLYSSNKEINTMLNYLTWIILLYCEKVIELGIEDFASLDIEREKRLINFS